MMRESLLLALGAYIIGFVCFWLFRDLSAALWFGIGGGLAMLNFLVAAYVVNQGFEKIRAKPLLFGLIFLKSMLFVAVVAVVLTFTKPQLLPFTLGIGLVIFGLVLWAAKEGRKLIIGK